MPLPTAESMVERTLAIYQRATASASVEHPPVDRLRVVEAFGYRRWSPSVIEADSNAEPESHVAQEPRPRSAFRRALTSLVPPRAARALKARSR